MGLDGGPADQQLFLRKRLLADRSAGQFEELITDGPTSRLLVRPTDGRAKRMVDVWLC
jgi:hypothetical protein